MKKYIILLGVFGLMIAGIIGLWSMVSHLKSENNRLSDNQRALLSDIRHYQTKDSLSVASVEKLTLNNNEFKKYCTELLQTVEDLNLKVKRLQSVAVSAVETKYNIETVIRDSVIVRYADSGNRFTAAMQAANAAFDTAQLRCIDYSDTWLRLSGCVEKNIFSGYIESYDTLISIVHRVPKRFWFIRYGTKAVRQEVLSKNPHSKINYTEYIELK